MTNRSAFDDRSKSHNVSKSKTVRQPESLGPFSKPTMSASIKTKYIVHSRHQRLTNKRFIPVNTSEAKEAVKKEFIHDAGQPYRLDFEDSVRRSQMMQTMHGSSVFRQTSPVTQDIL